MATSDPENGVSLRTAALVAGFAYLLSPATYAEFTIMTKLVIAGHIDQFVVNALDSIARCPTGSAPASGKLKGANCARLRITNAALTSAWVVNPQRTQQ